MASKTISFVASEELAEWLEDEAKIRMTSVSSTAQQLLAEKYREEKGEAIAGESESQGQSQEGGEERQGQKVGDDEGLMRSHKDKWYRPDGEHQFAVDLPDGRKRYYQTEEGLKTRLEEEFE